MLNEQAVGSIHPRHKFIFPIGELISLIQNKEKVIFIRCARGQEGKNGHRKRNRVGNPDLPIRCVRQAIAVGQNQDW